VTLNEEYVRRRRISNGMVRRCADSGIRYVQVGGKHCANNAETLLQMALWGLGIVRLVDAMVSQYITSGQLVHLLPDSHHAEPVPLQIVMPRDKHRLPRVRVMVDYLIEKFSTAPWREHQPTGLRDLAQVQVEVKVPRRRGKPGQ
jgi:DNA-binding transcriptional LysR family regulator